MEDARGSILNQIIGMGYRTDPKTNEIDIYTASHPSYSNNVIQAFELYPIFKHFGLTYTDAMNLPVNEWLRIRKAAKALKENQPPDSESQMFQLLKELIVARNSGEE